jgi:hypothetical protein
MDRAARRPAQHGPAAGAFHPRGVCLQHGAIVSRSARPVFRGRRHAGHRGHHRPLPRTRCATQGNPGADRHPARLVRSRLRAARGPLPDVRTRRTGPRRPGLRAPGRGDSGGWRDRRRAGRDRRVADDRRSLHGVARRRRARPGRRHPARRQPGNRSRPACRKPHGQSVAPAVEHAKRRRRHAGTRRPAGARLRACGDDAGDAGRVRHCWPPAPRRRRRCWPAWRP